MMRVLTEQHIAARPASRREPRSRATSARGRRPPPRARHRSVRSRRPTRAIAGALRTAFLIVVTVVLTGTLVIVLPELEAVGDEDDAVVRAAAPALPETAAGVVRLELTEDVEHFVAEGETLSGIAADYDVEAPALARYNDLEDPDTIVPGQRIVIPGPDSRRDLPE